MSRPAAKGPALIVAVLAVWTYRPVAGATGQQAPPAVFESVYSDRELDLNPDPGAAFWTSAPRVVVDHDYFGQPVAAPLTEVRSRWTMQNLYLLYSFGIDEL